MSWRDHVDVDPVFQCWIWNGKRSSNGRPVVWLGQRPTYAYKITYEETFGPVPEGLVLDHLCRDSMHCVNPMHLEAVTKSVNELRKSWQYRIRMKLCPRGHSLADGIITPHGGKLCRTCQKGLR